MEISERYLQPYPSKLQKLFEDPIKAQGQIVLIVEPSEATCQWKILADYVVVDLPSNYKSILGKPIL